MPGSVFSPGMSSGMPPSSVGPIAAAPTQMPGMMGSAGSRPIPWAVLSLWGRFVGLVLLFLGTLVAVLFASVPADCYTSTCGTGVAASVQYGILASRLLWTLGAGALVAAAAAKIHFILPEPSSDGPEANARFLAQRRGEMVLLLVGVLILLVLLLTAGTAIGAIP